MGDDAAMTQTTGPLPTSVRLTRWYLAAVAALLLGIVTVTVANYASLATQGITLVYSQAEMDEDDAPIGPAPEEGAGDPGASPSPMPPEETVGGMQYVDLIGLGLALLGGLVAAAGAWMLTRRSRWSVPFGLAAVAVTAAVGLIPVSIGVWAADYYAMGDLGQVLPFLLVSGLLVAGSVAAAVAIWRHRAMLGPA
jgi:hypothetical protein